MRRTRATCLSLALAAALLSCATPGEPEREATEPAKPAEPAAQRAPAKARAHIDRGGRSADCTRFEADDDRHITGDRAWLAAWCGLRTDNWPLAARAAAKARASFEVSGQLRRQIEMGLIEALAARHLAGSGASPGGLAASSTRARKLWLAARMPLHGELHDRFAGDLPYLLARAIHRNLLEDLRAPGGQPLRPQALLAIAWSEYRSFEQRWALPHVARASTRVQIDDGRLGRALAHLQTALELDRRAELTAGLKADLELFARLCDLLGITDTRSALASTLAAAAPAGHAEVAPMSREIARADITDLLETARGRRQLAAHIELIRRSASSALEPPPALIPTLRAHTALDDWTGDSWRLGYQGGRLLAEHGHRHDAKRYLQAAVDAIEKMRASLAAPLLRQRFFADKRPVYMALVDAYVGLDTANRTQADYRKALGLANALKARGLVDLLDGRIAPGATHAVELPEFAEESSLHKVADSVLAALERWGVSSEESAPPIHEPVRLPDSISDGLDDDTAVLEYLIAPRRSYVWVLTADGVRMRRLAGREEIEPLVDEFLHTLLQADDQRAQKRHQELSERLYVELIGPLEDILDDVDRVMIAPDARLYELPFEALARPRKGKQSRYLVAERTVSYVPSSSVLARLLRREAPEADSRKALVMGAPELDRSALDLMALADNLPQGGLFPLAEMFPDVPGTRDELAAVKKRLEDASTDVEMLDGPQATEGRLRAEELVNYGLIHLATHGVSDARPLRAADAVRSDFHQPALLLGRNDEEPDDGVVTLAEVLHRPTAARLVVLSGCTTGRGWTTLGDGAFGLAGAIIYSGSHNVIASTWMVADDETTQLMRAVYKALAAGDEPAQALRQGQLAMLEADHPPASWASFRLVGPGN